MEAFTVFRHEETAGGFAAILAFSALPSSAIVIYGDTTPPPDGSRGWGSELNWHSQEAARFELSDAALLTTIHWWGYYTRSDHTAADDFTLRIFADSGGTPEQNPSILDINVGAVTRVDTGLSSSLGDTNIYEYSAVISPHLLLADTPYYLSIVNDTTDFPAIWLWNYVESGTGYYRRNDQDTWLVGAGTEARFYLTGAAPPIPEPATLSLLGIGLIGLVARARRVKT